MIQWKGHVGATVKILVSSGVHWYKSLSSSKVRTWNQRSECLLTSLIRLWGIPSPWQCLGGYFLNHQAEVMQLNPLTLDFWSIRVTRNLQPVWQWHCLSIHKTMMLSRTIQISWKHWVLRWFWNLINLTHWNFSLK